MEESLMHFDPIAKCINPQIAQHRNIKLLMQKNTNFKYSIEMLMEFVANNVCMMWNGRYIMIL